MFNSELAETIGLTEKEMEFLKIDDTPEEFQKRMIRDFPYDFEEDGVEHFGSFRYALRKGKAHCFTGAMLGAAYIYLNNLGSPLVLRIEARDMAHHLAIYWKGGKIGCLGASRHIGLTGKPPHFTSYRDLVISYYPDYYNDITNDPADLTMRGYAGPMDLTIFGHGWLVAEDSLTDIVDYFDRLPQIKLFLEKPELYAEFRKQGDFYFID